MNHQYEDPAVFSEKVCRYLNDGGSVVLRIYGATKKRGAKNKWAINSNKWYGHVMDWNPVDIDNPDPYHIGQFLMMSDKVRKTVRGLEQGGRYCVLAQDRDTSELIAQSIVLLGDEEEDDSVEELDPFQNMMKQMQQAMMQRMVSEIAGTVEGIKDKKAYRATSEDELIPLTNGSYMTKESMIAELNERRKNEEKLLSEVQQLREHFQKEKDTQPGKLGGFLQLISSLLGGGGGGSQGNPLSSLLGGMDVGSLLGGMGMGNDFMKQSSPQGTVAGPMMGMPSMAMPSMVPMQQRMSPSMPEANPFAPLLSSLMGGMNFGANTDDDEEYEEEPPVKIHKPKPEKQERDDEVSDNIDKELLEEIRPLATKIFDDVWSSFTSGGVDAAKQAGATSLVNNGKALGYSKMVMTAMCMDADNMATLLLKALPATTRMIVKPLQGSIKPIVIDAIKLIDWDTWN